MQIDGILPQAHLSWTSTHTQTLAHKRSHIRTWTPPSSDRGLKIGCSSSTEACHLSKALTNVRWCAILLAAASLTEACQVLNALCNWGCAILSRALEMTARFHLTSETFSRHLLKAAPNRFGSVDELNHPCRRLETML